MKKKLLLSTCFLIFSFWAWSQQVQISGVVKSSADNLPLPGASVVIKGSTTGTTTDINGKYTIKAEPKQVLVYSFVGMTPQEITVTADTKTVDIVLAELAVMTSEVVVVGYGTQKKSVTTGAISGVKSKDIEKIPNGRVEQALQGKVSGVSIAANSGQPGSSSTINIRGVTNFGDNNPLWVVDGVVVGSSDIGNINQNDIASIEVLKDAASAAIYGTRAATGVILVTTKKGKAGKMTVNYNTFYGTSAPAHVLSLCNATQYATLINERQTNGGLDIRFPNVGQYGVGTDWQKEIFNNNALRYAHELSLTGGNEKSSYYASVALTSQDGIVSTEISKYDKISLRLNSDHKISKVFAFGQTFSYTHIKSLGIGNTNSEFGGPLSSAINLDPITPVVITDPIVASQSPYNLPNVLKDANGNPYGISPNVGQEMSNPLAYTQTRLGQYGWSDYFTGSAYLDVNFTKKLKFRTSVGATKVFWGGVGFTPVYYLNASTSNNVNFYGRSDGQNFDWNIDNTLMYSDKIQDHEFSILLGQGAYVNGNSSGTSNTIQNLPITSYQDASFNFDIPQANRISGTWDGTEHKVASLFARANYNFKEKYLFTGIVRRDGSTRFGANYKYGIFPSFSLGWVVSKESFWKTNNVVNSLKLRGGYGVTGNDNNIDNFGYLSQVIGGFNYTIGNSEQITTGYAPKTLDNPDLHWEQTSQLDLGFDLRFLTDFNLVFDIFKKKTTGILRNIPIPGYVGVSNEPVGNIADMENKGVEFELGYNKSFGDLTFSANGNIAYLKNEVTYVNSDADFIAGGAGFQTMGPVTRIQVGQSFNSFYGFKTDGIFQNWDEINAYKNPAGDLIQPKAVPGDWKWTDTNGDGAITEADKQFLGTSIPKYTFGLTLNAAYKGFDLMVFGQGVAGNKIFQGLRRLDIEYSNWQTIAMSRWTGDGTSNTYPRLTAKDDNLNFGNMSDFYLEKGDYFRIKQVQLGYTLKSDLLKKVDISKLRIYVQAENLFTITGYTGYDPEIGGGVYGIDKGFYPQARSFIGGIQLQF